MNRFYAGRVAFCLFIICLFCFARESYAQSFDVKQVQQITSSVIKKSYAACVRIWGFDTLKKAQNSAQFSGVVVTAEGHILTAAHAIRPGKIYLVNFPDGRSVLAEGKGRIASESQGRPDMGMIKIVENGKWPYTEMGWSSSLKVNSLCISIAYPTTLSQKLPSLRFGRISRLKDTWGFLVSTCAMEPGDSGGPLFDEFGRVVALHSRIDVKEEINYEIPVDLYRKYWSALNEVRDYESLPLKEDEVGSDLRAAEIKPIAELENIEKLLAESTAFRHNSCLTISSTINGKSQQVYGTILLFAQKSLHSKFKSGTFLLSKSSLVGDHVVAEAGTGEKLNPVVVSRDKENDLVLLYIARRLKSAVTLTALSDTSSVKFAELGKFLLSAIPGHDNHLSVLGSTCFGLDKKFSSGYFGASATFINKQIVLTRIASGSPAEKAGLMLQDQVTGINGVSISLPPDYGREIMKYEPGDTIVVNGNRNGVSYSLPVSLGIMPITGNHPADHFAGGKSQRRDGFKSVFTHDAILKADECGGPVFDLDGKFLGINIARFSRTSCLVMPISVIQQFILNSL